MKSVIEILPCLLYIQPIEILGSGKKETNAINTGINSPVCKLLQQRKFNNCSMHVTRFIAVFFKVVWDICGY